MLSQSSPNLVHHLIQPPQNLPVSQHLSNAPISPATSITPVSLPSYTDMNIPGMPNTSNIMNANQNAYKLILPKQSASPPALPINPPIVPATNISSDPFVQSDTQEKCLMEDNITDSYLKQLLEEHANEQNTGNIPAIPERGSPHSSSSESLPSLDAILNTSSLQNVTVTSKEEETPSTHNPSDTIADVIRNTDSNSSHTNSSELSTAFQKSCRTTDEKCAVCKEPKNLISCRMCPRLYHADCHVPSVTSLKPFSRNDWICLMCRDVLTFPVPEEDTKRKLIDLQGRELLICERILLEVFVHPKSWFFHNKVSKKVPNYYKVIKRPMDLSTIRMKLSPAHFEHYGDVEAFCDDMRLIFQNCFIFNTEGSDVYIAGKEVEMFFEKLLSQYFPELADEAHESESV